MARSVWLYAVVPALLALATWWWILDLDLWLDDFMHLYYLANNGYFRLVLSPHGGHLFLTANSVYFLLYHLVGLTPRYWFVLMLLTHVANVLLLFRVVYAWTARAPLAALLATAWAVSPIAQGSLSWFAIYGHVLVATFVLWLLGDLASFSETTSDVPAWVRLKWSCLLFGAATSYGFGLGIALVFWVAALLVLPPGSRRAGVRTFVGCALFLIVLYPLQRWVFLQLWGSEAVPFDTAALVRWLDAGYLPRVGISFISFLGYGFATLLTGPLAIYSTPSRLLGIWQGDDLVWFSRSLAVLAGVAAVAVLRRTDTRRLRAALAVSVLLTGCYGILAFLNAARSTFALYTFGAEFPLAVVLEARYQYAGPALEAVLIGLILATAFDRWPRVARPTYALLFGWLACAGPSYWTMRNALLMPGVRRSISLTAAATVMDGLRAQVSRQPIGSDVYLDNVDTPFPFMGHNASFPGVLAIFVIMNASDRLDGRRVHFVERDPAMLQMLRSQGGRAATLVVPPSEVRS